MRVSKNKLPAAINRELYGTLCKVLAAANTETEIDEILEELLSPTERVAIMKRLGMAAALAHRDSYEVISKRLFVSSATIAALQERIDKPGWQKLIKNVKLQQEADKWTKKLKSIIPVFKKR